MRIKFIFEPGHCERALLPVLFFLFMGLRDRGHQLQFVSPYYFKNTGEEGLLLTLPPLGAKLLSQGSKEVLVLEKGQQDYSLSLPALEQRLSFTPGPNLDLFRPLEPEEGEEGSPLSILIFWWGASKEELICSLRALELVDRGLPRLSIKVITWAELPMIESSLSLQAITLPDLDPQLLVREYNRSNLCLGLSSPSSLPLLEVLACETPLLALEGSSISFLKGDYPEALLQLPLDPQKLAVNILSLLKLGQVARRVSKEGKRAVNEYNASGELDRLEDFLLKMTEELAKKGESEEQRDIEVEEDGLSELEEGLTLSSISLREALQNFWDYLQGKKKRPF